MQVQLLLQIVLSMLLFSSVALLIFSLFRAPAPTDAAPHRRVAQALGAEEGAPLFAHPVWGRPLGLALAVVQRMRIPGLRASVQRTLDAAGNPHNATPDEQIAFAVACGLAAGAGTAGLGTLLLEELPLLITVALAAGGFAAPFAALRESGQKRLTRINKALPYTLDLVALVMEAGATFREAVETVIHDDPHNELNGELRTLLAEIDLGTPRPTALQHMADRVPVDAMRSIVGAINQAESLGTPLAGILKTQSQMLRMQRGVRAEKISASASLRILVPSMLILMAVVLTVFAPILIRWVRGGLPI
jgi:tight adherence protein C